MTYISVDSCFNVLKWLKWRTVAKLLSQRNALSFVLVLSFHTLFLSLLSLQSYILCKLYMWWVNEFNIKQGWFAAGVCYSFLLVSSDGRKLCNYFKYLLSSSIDKEDSILGQFHLCKASTINGRGFCLKLYQAMQLLMKSYGVWWKLKFIISNWRV